MDAPITSDFCQHCQGIKLMEIDDFHENVLAITRRIKALEYRSKYPTRNIRRIWCAQCGIVFHEESVKRVE